jgi:hypothetical protein
MRRLSRSAIRVPVLAAGVAPLFIASAGCRQAASARIQTFDNLQRVAPADATKDPKAPTLWYDAQQLTIEGKGWTDTEQFYDRLPTRAKGVVTDAVWGLSKDTAGMCVRFVTDASKISARWTVTSQSLAMPHMPATGVSGLDLYVNDRGTWRWAGAGRPTKSPTNECSLADGIPAGPHEYALYLPLYNGVKSLEIGLPPSATLARPASRPPSHAKPICYYGTSIAQGGCASRPGMAHVAILGRVLDRPTINLGFSGSGKMEPAMADLLAELDAAAYVLDCLPNMTAAMVKERVEPFVEALRKARPDTPIILVENTMYDNGRFLPKVRDTVIEKNRALYAAYEHLIAKGVRKLTYVPCDSLVGTDGESTVDGAHCTDLGFFRFAHSLAPVLYKTLGP